MSSGTRLSSIESLAPSRDDQASYEPSALIERYSKSLHIREEIVDVARKLWTRQYVDGNAGNLSCRFLEHFVLCTPTMMSKGDLEVDDICLLDLTGRHCWGHRRATSEILLHLEIYKANPAAQAVVHCHPPHATAFAITGTVPPMCVLAEADLFIGPAMLVPYETPGTRLFAESVAPYVRNHNSLILANHGVVCWADTVTHAEWCVEVLDGYCHSLILAAQLGKPLVKLPPAKVQELLEIKKRLGLPDARLDSDEQPRSGRCWTF